MNKSLRGLRIKEFPKLTNLIQAIKSFAADLTNVNRHRHIRVKPGTQVSNTVDRLDSRVTDLDGIKFRFLIIGGENQQLRTQFSNR